MSMQWVIETLHNRRLDETKRRDTERRESLMAAFGDDATLDAAKARIAELETENKAHRDVQDGARAIVARCNKRVAELEAQRGIPARCPKCGGHVTIVYDRGTVMYRVQCARLTPCNYSTKPMLSPGDAWRGHQTNVDAREAKP